MNDDSNKPIPLDRNLKNRLIKMNMTRDKLFSRFTNLRDQLQVLRDKIRKLDAEIENVRRKLRGVINGNIK